MAVVNARGYRRPGRSGATFLCGYVQRTLGQLGDDALALPLISRHLADCPACRAHRRRIALVDRALQRELLWETPPVFAGRWEEIRTRLGFDPEPDRVPRQRSGIRAGLLTVALSALLLLLGVAWRVDHAPPEPVSVIAVAPGVAITAASTEGEEATVNVESTDAEDGTVYLWLDDTGSGDDAGFEEEQW